MTEEEKQSKKDHQKNYCKKLKAYKDELLLEKARGGNYYKKGNKCKNMSKIKIEKTLQFKWL